MTGPRSPAKWFRALLSAFLAVTLVSPAYAASPVGSRTLPVTRPRDVSALQPGRVQTIVEASLTTALANGGKQTFLVTVRGQADVNLAADEASSRAAEQGKTPRAQRLARANAVISNLQQVSARGQSNLLPLLNQLQNDGAVSVFEQFWITNVIAVTGDATAVKALAARPEVEKITAGKTYRVMGGKSASPRAPAATTSVVPQWGATQTIEWNINQIGAPDAWALGFDGTGIVVANLDTGVESGHPALARKWRGADGSNPAYSWFDAVNHYNSGPYDDHGHGTHTMGTIAGSDEAGNNMIGVAPGARWIAAKILDSTGSGSDVGILEASQWLLAPGGDPSMAPDVVSNSWGGGAGIDEFLRPMVQAWRAAGIVPVFANGNTRNGATSCLVSVPANYPESIGVGATDSNNQVAGFSCRGPSPYGEIKPELSAPGVNVRSSVPGGSYQGGWNGTSMATPHVAGVAALLRQANASLTVDEIEQVLIETATPLTDSQYPSVPNNGYGWGLVNAFDAVASVAAGTGTVNGRVTTSGDDLESPAITHTAITEAQSGLDLPVSAQVADNVSVTEVNLYVKPDADPFYAVIPMTRSAGTFKNGTYTAAIPGALVKTPAFQYYVRATDYGGNFATTPIYPVSVIPGLTPGSGTDFESQPVGWSHGGNNDPWQWGVPTSGPNAAHSGNKVYATNLTGTYADNTNAYLATPPIDLTAATGGVKLEWYEWYELEQNYDYADVWVRDAAGGVTTVLSRTGSNTSWQLKSIDLTPWIGQTVTVLFNLRTDISIVRAGWYLDDVALTEPDSIPPAPPANLSGTATTDGLVNLSWNANTEPDLVHYRVYRSATSGSGYANVGTVTAPGFIDTTAPADVPAYYAVTAVDQWGNESGYSNEITLTPTGPVVYFFDDMEHGENGWTHGGVNDQWQHGTPNVSPVPYSGTNLWGTNLTGSY
ncbi:MAG TPA: S8 family serine peptidase, partial [Symbiobacteriaceae bacterium]|nr:S8 family serine peptidase [Symbiobacteriaceae bacterium]